MANEVLQEVKKDLNDWMSLGHRRPHLTAILVGNDPASNTYVRNKMKAATVTGWWLITFVLQLFISHINLVKQLLCNHKHI